MLKDFRQFILRGNLVDLAVAVVIGAAFGAVVSAMVADLTLMARYRTEPPVDPPSTRKCPECLSEIPTEARRCAFCTAEIEPQPAA